MPDSPTNQPWPMERESRLRRMLAAGCSRVEIALALGVTPKAVTGKLQRLGIKPVRGDPYAAAMRRAERERHG